MDMSFIAQLLKLLIRKKSAIHSGTKNPCKRVKKPR